MPALVRRGLFSSLQVIPIIARVDVDVSDMGVSEQAKGKKAGCRRREGLSPSMAVLT